MTRQRGPDSLHSRLIADYVAARRGTKRRGFVRELRNIVSRSDGLRAQVQCPGWELEPVGLLPDAFHVNRRDKELTLIEAEVTSRITPAKWQSIIELWWLFDCDAWKTWVHTIDRAGTIFSVNTPRVAMLERRHHREPAAFLEALARNPPGMVVWTEGQTQRLADDWPDAVAEEIRRKRITFNLDDELLLPLRAAAPEVFDGEVRR